MPCERVPTRCFTNLSLLLICCDVLATTHVDDLVTDGALHFDALSVDD